MTFVKLSAVISNVVLLIAVASVLLPCWCQREPSLSISFNQFLRATKPVPAGRSANVKDVIIRFYGNNATKPSNFRLKEIRRLVNDPQFDLRKPTVLYAHGYVELVTDKSVQTIVKAYLRRGGFNILLVDWSNLAFGNYVPVAVDVAAVGKETGRALYRLLKQGLSLAGLHLVGHSLGSHIMAYAARSLSARGLRIQRLTGLDPAYPGFYPPIFGQPISKADAAFVDIIHTDGGGYGTPSTTGHADFWPNGGQAKQPGCLSATLLLTDEDFCSHWRSWRIWAESVAGGEFLSRRCDSYDSFLRGKCKTAQLELMGLHANASLKGNFYLRTAAKRPFTLGVSGAS